MTDASQTTTVAVLGTGVMGAPIARNLRKNGFTVHAWNRTASKTQALKADGVDAFDTPAKAVRGANVIVTMLKDGPAVREAMHVIEETASVAPDSSLKDVIISMTRRPLGAACAVAPDATTHIAAAKKNFVMSPLVMRCRRRHGMACRVRARVLPADTIPVARGCRHAGSSVRAREAIRP